MTTDFDPYYKWLGIPPKDQPPNHYRLLGIELFEKDADVIDTAANKQMAYVQGCATGPHMAVSQKILNEIAAARLCLLDATNKAKYDALLKSTQGESKASAKPPEAPRVMDYQPPPVRRAASKPAKSTTVKTQEEFADEPTRKSVIPVVILGLVLGTIAVGAVAFAVTSLHTSNKTSAEMAKSDSRPEEPPSRPAPPDKPPVRPTRPAEPQPEASAPAKPVEEKPSVVASKPPEPPTVVAETKPPEVPTKPPMTEVAKPARAMNGIWFGNFTVGDLAPCWMVARENNGSVTGKFRTVEVINGKRVGNQVSWSQADSAERADVTATLQSDGEILDCNLDCTEIKTGKHWKSAAKLRFVSEHVPAHNGAAIFIAPQKHQDKKFTLTQQLISGKPLIGTIRYRFTVIGPEGMLIDPEHKAGNAVFFGTSIPYGESIMRGLDPDKFYLVNLTFTIKHPKDGWYADISHVEFLDKK